MKRGRASEIPCNIFTTWLDYQESKGVIQAELIRQVNAKLGKAYDNKTFYNWKHQIRTLPDIVLNECITPELPMMYAWYFKNNKEAKVNYEALAAAFAPCVKLIE